MEKKNGRENKASPSVWIWKKDRNAKLKKKKKKEQKKVLEKEHIDRWQHSLKNFFWLINIFLASGSKQTNQCFLFKTIEKENWRK